MPPKDRVPKNGTICRDGEACGRRLYRRRNRGRNRFCRRGHCMAGSVRNRPVRTAIAFCPQAITLCKQAIEKYLGKVSTTHIILVALPKLLPRNLVQAEYFVI